MFRNLVEFFEAGRLSYFRGYGNDEYRDTKINSVEKIKEYSSGNWNRHKKSKIGRFFVDMTPYEIRSFRSFENIGVDRKNSDNWKEFYEEVKKLDLGLTKEDHEGWEEWIKYIINCEIEDGEWEEDNA